MSDSDSDDSLDVPVSGIVTLLALVLVPLLVVSAIPGIGVWYTVEDGERGVETQFGAIEESNVAPGLNFKLPLVDGVSTYNVRAQEYTRTSNRGEGAESGADQIEALTSEGLNVDISVTVRYNLMPNRTGFLYQNVGTTDQEVIETLVRPTISTAIRSSSSTYSVEEIYSEKRDEFAQDVKKKVRDELEPKGVNVQAIQIRNVMLPQEVREAIQEKQATQERIETKQNRLEIAELERQRKVIEAKGIAQSNRIIGSSLSKQYLEWYWIQEGLEKGDSMYVVRNAPGDINGTDSSYNGTIGPELVKDIDTVGNESVGNVSVDDADVTEDS